MYARARHFAKNGTTCSKKAEESLAHLAFFLIFADNISSLSHAFHVLWPPNCIRCYQQITRKGKYLSILRNKIIPLTGQIS